MSGHYGEIVFLCHVFWLVQAGWRDVHGGEIEVLCYRDQSYVLLM